MVRLCGMHRDEVRRGEKEGLQRRAHGPSRCKPRRDGSDHGTLMSRKETGIMLTTSCRVITPRLLLSVIHCRRRCDGGEGGGDEPVSVLCFATTFAAVPFAPLLGSSREVAALVSIHSPQGEGASQPSTQPRRGRAAMHCTT